MRSSPEMRVSLVLRSILAVLGKYGLQGVNVVEYGHGAFVAQQFYQFGVAGRGRSGDADEWHAGGAGSAGIVYGVAQIPGFAMWNFSADFVQTFGMRLGIRHVIHANDGLKCVFCKTIERELRFPAEAAGKDGERVIFSQTIEEAFGGEPAFAENQTVIGIAQEDFLEAADHIVISHLLAEFLNHAVRELPVVIEAAAVFPDLDFVTGRFCSGEVQYRGLNGGAIGFADVHENAVHIEYE